MKINKLIKIEIFMRLLFHTIYQTSIALLPMIIRFMIDSDYENGLKDVLTYILLFTICIAMGMISQYISQLNAWKLDKKFFKHVRNNLFSWIISMNSSKFNRNAVPEYISMITNDVEAGEEYIEYKLQIIESIISFIIYGAFLVVLDYRISIIVIVSGILITILPKITGKKLSDRKNMLLKSTANYMEKTTDLLNGHQYVNQDTIDKFDSYHNHNLEILENSRYNFGKYKTFTNVFNGTIMYLIDIVIFSAISYMLFSKSITVGQATATFAYIANFSYPLRSIIDSINSLKSVSSVYNKVIDNTKVLQSLSSEKQTLPFDIEFTRVSKSIGEISLSDVNIVFKKGNKYAIIGKNGSGKSTLLDMIMKRKDVDSGEILFSGREYDEIIAKNNIFYIRQKNHYFSNTLMENISVLGSYKVKELEFIRKEHLEKMFSSGNNANNLSGGEKQIMSMYQAINSNKSVILLDEPFSALSEELEFFYTKSLLKLNGTVVLVTHNKDKKYLELFDEVINVDYFLSK